MALVLYDEGKLTPFQHKERQFTFSLSLDSTLKGPAPVTGPVIFVVKIQQDWEGVGIAAVVWDSVSIDRS